MSAYANVVFTTICKCYVKSKFHMSGVHCESAVRFGQAVPAYLITAHHLCAFLLYLLRGCFQNKVAVWQLSKKASCVAAFKKSAPSTAGTHTGGVQ